jgi:outer membrane protein TolC
MHLLKKTPFLGDCECRFLRVQPEFILVRFKLLKHFIQSRIRAWAAGLLLIAPAVSASLSGQTSVVPPSPVPGPPSSASFQGSVPKGTATAQPIDLSLDDAMQRGLQTNLGIILSGTQTEGARAQRLSQLQTLLPSVDFNARETATQVDLPAEGLRLPGIPKIIGPFGYTDVRASMTWSLINVESLRNYLASRHNFAAAQLSAEDAHDLVVLTVGNAYLLVLADETEVESVEAQEATAKVSLDQAAANHQAGTAPLLDELRARVDYQSIQQQLIAAQDALEKDKLALARTIGLPLDQSFNLTDKAPYAPFDALDADTLIKQAKENRKDLASLVEAAAAAADQRRAATAARFPTVSTSADYGDIGTTLAHSHGTVDATATVSVPVFEEFALRGQAEEAQAQLDTAKAQLSDRQAQVEADVRDALLDIASAQKEVEVAESSRSLANEALKEAQERYANGVSDNLAVSEAQQSVAQADSQYVTSLYRHNVAKLSLARALGAGQDYRKYVGGK